MEISTGRVALCVVYLDFQGLGGLLQSVVGTCSEVQGILFLVPLPGINELYAILDVSTVCSSLNCAFGCYHIALSSGAQRKSAFVAPHVCLIPRKYLLVKLRLPQTSNS